MTNILKELVSLQVLVIAASLAVPLLGGGAQEPVRPTIDDPGDVKVIRRGAARIDRSRAGPARPSKPAFNMLVVLTDPEGAQITINGEYAGRALDGKFSKELRTGRRYKVTVSAGPDYEPYTEETVLKYGPPWVISAAMVEKYGVVTIFPAMDGVNLLIDNHPVPGETLHVDKENKTITIDRIAVGKHRITYDLPGYVLYRRDFEIAGGTVNSWNFIPAPAVDDLIILTDPETTVYVDGEEKGMTPDDGILKMRDLKLGVHDVKLIKDGYEPYDKPMTFDYEKPVRLAYKLVPLPATAEFSDDFDHPNPQQWRMPPSGWKMEKGRLFIDNSPTLGYPAKVNFWNFEMTFHLKLTNGGGAAWAVRVKDAENYYLFYLSGPEGLFPNRFVTYIVRDNKFDSKDFFSNVNVPIRLKAGDEYTVHVTGMKNVIEQTIIPNLNGEPLNLGAFKDDGRPFLYGGVGFRTVGPESFSVDDLYVVPKK